MEFAKICTVVVQLLCLNAVSTADDPVEMDEMQRLTTVVKQLSDLQLHSLHNELKATLAAVESQMATTANMLPFGTNITAVNSSDPGWITLMKQYATQQQPTQFIHDPPVNVTQSPLNATASPVSPSPDLPVTAIPLAAIHIVASTTTQVPSLPTAPTDRIQAITPLPMMTTTTAVKTVAIKNSTNSDVSFAGEFERVQYGNRTRVCARFSTSELVNELKMHGGYIPSFMAWDVEGVQQFLKVHVDEYEKESSDTLRKQSGTIDLDLDGVEAMIKNLDVKTCSFQNPEIKSQLFNITNRLRSYYSYKSSDVASILIDPVNRSGRSLFGDTPDSLDWTLRKPRNKRSSKTNFAATFLDALRATNLSNTTDYVDSLSSLYRKVVYSKKSANSFHAGSTEFSLDDAVPEQMLRDNAEEADESPDGIGTVHSFDCVERGSVDDGYVRMCSTCNALRLLPSRFFPPFINELKCSESMSCLHFYGASHGKCLQRKLSFQILENVGTETCQLWRKFHLAVRVACECFVDQMSFFANYV